MTKFLKLTRTQPWRTELNSREKITILFSLLLLLALIVQPWPARPQIISKREVDLSTYPAHNRQLAKEHIEKNPLLTTLTKNPLTPWKHFPEGNIRSNGYLYYYHSHRKNEHGHFHIFLSKPDSFSHLIAISINNEGKPVGLFTTSRWVTGETPATKKELLRALEAFHLEETLPLNAYLNALVTYYTPHIAHLVSLENRNQKNRKVLNFMHL